MKPQDAREGNEAVEHGTPVTTSQSEPGGGLANTREGQMERRSHILESAGYWFKASRYAQDSGQNAEAIMCMENAYNHVENALAAARDFIEAYFVKGVLRFPDGLTYREHAKKILSLTGGSSDASGVSSQTPSLSLLAVPDVKEEEKTLEEPGDVAANTVQGPMALKCDICEARATRRSDTFLYCDEVPQIARQGDWFTTFQGIKFYPLDPRESEINITDIAHALSMLCRYGGHSREFYSVAQHSVHVCELIRELAPAQTTLALQGLIHDATEAYIGDMVRPLKLSMPAYREVEDHLEIVIHRALNVPVPEGHDRRYIKAADNTLLMTERRDFVNHGNVKWSTPNEPWKRRLFGVPPDRAEEMFLLSWKSFKASSDPEGSKSSDGSGLPKSGSSSPATVREQMEPRVHRVAIQLCELCLEGKPGECHTPGCALFLHDSPGHPILPELYEILVPSGIVEQPKKDSGDL